MTDITIPREALVKAAKVLHDHAEIFVDVPWEDLSDGDQEAYIEEARAACIAMLRNWPGMYVPKVEREPLIPTKRSTRKQVAIDWPAIILPLTESGNDKG